MTISTSTEERTSPVDDDLGTVTIRVAYRPRGAVVHLGGDLDAHTTPMLRSLLATLLASGHAGLVLDLRSVTFLGAAGVGMIAGLGAQARRAGGSLTVWEPRAHIRRLLELTCVSPRVAIEDGESRHDLRADLALVASRPAGHDAVDADLERIVALASATVPGADGASVTLRRDGRLLTVAASDDTVRRMDGHQYATGEGPCIAAATDGTPYESAVLAEESRWSAFVPLASADGIRAIVSSPLLAHGAPIGAFNMYSSAAGGFGIEGGDLGGVFASYAAEVVAHGDDTLTDAAIGIRIDEGLRSRALLSLAQGILMARLGVSSDGAAGLLHRDARAAGVSTIEQAADVLASAIVDPPAGDRG